MKPIEVNWNIQLPDQLQIGQMWDELRFKIIDRQFELQTTGLSILMMVTL